MHIWIKRVCILDDSRAARLARVPPVLSNYRKAACGLPPLWKIDVYSIFWQLIRSCFAPFGLHERLRHKSDVVRVRFARATAWPIERLGFRPGEMVHPKRNRQANQKKKSKIFFPLF